VASYYTSVEFMDKNVGLLLSALHELGLDDSTLVIYMGDNGYLLGHHGRIEKHMMWEEAIRVPLIIRAPSLAEGGRRVDAMVEGIDLVPTILEAVGAATMGTLHGESLVSLITGRTSRGKEFVFSEYLDDNKAMIRTDQWKYIFTSGKSDLGLGYETGAGPPGRDERLYNLKEDPQEFHDLADNPKHADVLADLRSKMLEVFISTHPKASHLPEGLSIQAQLEWFCEPSAREIQYKNKLMQMMQEMMRKRSGK
jgi:arylsulfatase A-like enzyme